MTISKDDCVLEINSLEYDRHELLNIFANIKNFARIKHLPWSTANVDLSRIDKSPATVIEYGQHNMADDSKSHLSFNLLEIPYIKNLTDKFNFNQSVGPHDTKILWFRPGKIFHPHIDSYAASMLIFPILPETNITPIDFYFRENLELTPGDYTQKVTRNDIIYTHEYSNKYPTIINSHQIHGVRMVKIERISLMVRIPENFNSIRKKYQEQTLIKRG